MRELDDAGVASCQEKAKSFSTEELEVALDQLSLEIAFLRAQMKADAASYSSDRLKATNERISNMKKMSKIFDCEITRRNETLMES